jgi:hypothetical protein
MTVESFIFIVLLDRDSEFLSFSRHFARPVSDVCGCVASIAEKRVVRRRMGVLPDVSV